jgi:hypothetical protein
MNIKYFDNYVDFYKNKSILYTSHIVLVKHPELENMYFVEKDRTGLLQKDKPVHIDEITEILLTR